MKRTSAFDELHQNFRAVRLAVERKILMFLLRPDASVQAGHRSAAERAERLVGRRPRLGGELGDALGQGPRGLGL